MRTKATPNGMRHVSWIYAESRELRIPFWDGRYRERRVKYPWYVINNRQSLNKLVWRVKKNRFYIFISGCFYRPVIIAVRNLHDAFVFATKTYVDMFTILGEFLSLKLIEMYQIYHRTYQTTTEGKEEKNTRTNTKKSHKKLRICEMFQLHIFHDVPCEMVSFQIQ